MTRGTEQPVDKKSYSDIHIKVEKISDNRTKTAQQDGLITHHAVLYNTMGEVRGKINQIVGVKRMNILSEAEGRGDKKY